MPNEISWKFLPWLKNLLRAMLTAEFGANFGKHLLIYWANLDDTIGIALSVDASPSVGRGRNTRSKRSSPMDKHNESGATRVSPGLSLPQIKPARTDG